MDLDSERRKQILHCRGIEPRSPAWQARILPLNQQCLRNVIFPFLQTYVIRIKYALSRKLTTMGIEPTIFRFEVGRLIHWATRPMQKCKKECIMYDNTEMTFFVCLVASCAGSNFCRYIMSNEGHAIDRHELSSNKYDDRRRFVLIQVISATGKLRWPSG